MKNIAEIRSKIERLKPILKKKFKVKSIGVFGSYSRGEQNDESDIDILVEFSDDSISLFDFIELEDFLAEMLGSKVDLVMKDTLKPRIKDRILREAVSI